MNNEIQQKFLDILRRDAQILSRLRHPNIVQITKPLEETKNELWFETEPISISLANYLGYKKNSSQIKTNIELDEIDKKLGIIQICETLSFVHSNAQIIHLNISPESIFITADNKWKLAGFGYSSTALHKSNDESKYVYSGVDQNEEQKSYIPINPSLNYLAPEYIYLKTFDFYSDMFGLGCLMYELYAGHRLLTCENNLSRYKSSISTLFPLKTSNISSDVISSLESLIIQDPTKRLTASQLLETSYFNDISVKTLQYLANILEKDDRSKLEFFKGLKSTFTKFTPKTLKERVLSVLLEELKHTVLVPIILPNIFCICEIVNDDSMFYFDVFPKLIPLTKVTEPFQIPLIMMKNFEYIAKRIKEDDINQYLVEVIRLGLSHSKSEVVFAALEKSRSIIQLIDYHNLSSVILPQVLKLLNSQSSKLKVTALLTTSKFVTLLNKQIIDEKIFPSLFKIWKSDNDPATLIAVVGVCDVLSIKYGEEFTGKRILPFISSLIADQNLSRKQFDTFINIFNSMVKRVSEFTLKGIEQREKLALAKEESPQIDIENFNSTLPSVNTKIAKITQSPQPQQIHDSNMSEDFRTMLNTQEKRKAKYTQNELINEKTNSQIDFFSSIESTPSWDDDPFSEDSNKTISVTQTSDKNELTKSYSKDEAEPSLSEKLKLDSVFPEKNQSIDFNTTGKSLNDFNEVFKSYDTSTISEFNFSLQPISNTSPLQTQSNISQSNIPLSPFNVNQSLQPNPTPILRPFNIQPTISIQQSDTPLQPLVLQPTYTNSNQNFVSKSTNYSTNQAQDEWLL